MDTSKMSDDYYNSIIYSKEELEREFDIWRFYNPAPEKLEYYIDWARDNNSYVSLINNYEFLKKIKSDSLINYKKIKELKE